MAYGVIRTDNVKATVTGAIRSAKYYVSTTLTAIENGNLVQVDVLDGTGNREMFKAVAPASLTVKNVGVVATPELIYDETTHKSLSDFINPAGKSITVLMLAPNDLLSITDECIVPLSGTAVVGNFVTLTVAGTKWTEKASVTTETVVGKIVARELYKKGAYINVVEIVTAN